MTRDLTPNTADLWRLVQTYGSLEHTARAIGVSRDELDAWISGKKPIPPEYYNALLTLIAGLKRD